jgi:hypothetical protein
MLSGSFARISEIAGGALCPRVRMRDRTGGEMGRDERRPTLWRDARHQGDGFGLRGVCSSFNGIGRLGMPSCCFFLLMLVVFWAWLGGLRWRNGIRNTVNEIMRWTSDTDTCGQGEC